MAQEPMVLVYRFRREEPGAKLSPQHMWGTMEAIAQLPDCVPILDSEREVLEKLLDNGFYFEHVPTVYKDIEE